MLDFIFTTLVCAWESIVYCFYNVPYVDYAVYLFALIIGLKIYTKLFRRKKKVVVKAPIQQNISKKEKLLEIWDELDSAEQEEYREDMTDDEWLDFRYELIKKKGQPIKVKTKKSILSSKQDKPKEEPQFVSVDVGHQKILSPKRQMNALSNLNMLMNMPRNTISTAIGFFVSDLVLDNEKFTCKNLQEMINKEYIMDQIKMFVEKRVTESNSHFIISKKDLILKINTFFDNLLNESTWSSTINTLSNIYNNGSINQFIKYRVIETNS